MRQRLALNAQVVGLFASACAEWWEGGTIIAASCSFASLALHGAGRGGVIAASSAIAWRVAWRTVRRGVRRADVAGCAWGCTTGWGGGSILGRGGNRCGGLSLGPCGESGQWVMFRAMPRIGAAGCVLELEGLPTWRATWWAVRRIGAMGCVRSCAAGWGGGCAWVARRAGAA